jgi:cation transport ATPase
MPSIAHRKRESEILDVGLQEVAVGDTLVIYPHDICPVDRGDRGTWRDG